ncbi:MAG: phosphatidylserine/phosphatidylglycerophosphate/cardiolipin synthase family protein [Chloroflexi bacterium]|nr:phosphatidylserine/phosphatidylglycerophosphate/cardiolipin synthase family protein [Chloroflexota bacterium]
MKILYTTSEIRKTVTDLFSDSTVRRVAVVAFVGEGAESFLPNPKGLELICWAKPGSTSADSLRDLKKRGAKISLADSMHMKVYWAEGRGAVITSANLSMNALGSGNLQEIGILVPSDSLNIDRVIRSVQPRTLEKEDLSWLDKQSREIEIAVRRTAKKSAQGSRINFQTWYELPDHREWKLGWWDAEGAIAQTAKNISKQRYGVAEPEEMLVCNATDYRTGDWLLTFGLVTDRPTEIEWRTVDFVTKVSPKDKKAYVRAYPYQAIQVWTLRYYPPPPFTLDSKFKLAFKKALSEYGAEAIKQLKTARIPKWITDRVYTLYTRV